MISATASKTHNKASDQRERRFSRRAGARTGFQRPRRENRPAGVWRCRVELAALVLRRFLVILAMALSRVFGGVGNAVFFGNFGVWRFRVNRRFPLSAD